MFRIGAWLHGQRETEHEVLVLIYRSNELEYKNKYGEGWKV